MQLANAGRRVLGKLPESGRLMKACLEEGESLARAPLRAFSKTLKFLN